MCQPFDQHACSFPHQFHFQQGHWNIWPKHWLMILGGCLTFWSLSIETCHTVCTCIYMYMYDIIDPLKIIILILRVNQKVLL